MTVLVYIAIFAAIVGICSIGGAICESERAERRMKRFARRAARLAEGAAAIALLPIEAANAAYEKSKAR